MLFRNSAAPRAICRAGNGRKKLFRRRRERGRKRGGGRKGARANAIDGWTPICETNTRGRLREKKKARRRTRNLDMILLCVYVLQHVRTMQYVHESTLCCFSRKRKGNRRGGYNSQQTPCHKKYVRERTFIA